MSPGRVRTISLLVAGLALAVGLAFFVSPHASTAPDGFEKVAAAQALDTEQRPHDLAGGPLAEYRARGVRDSSLSTGVAGVIGVAATFVMTAGGVAIVRRRGERRSRTRAPAAARPGT